MNAFPHSRQANPKVQAFPVQLMQNVDRHPAAGVMYLDRDLLGVSLDTYFRGTRALVKVHVGQAFLQHAK